MIKYVKGDVTEADFDVLVHGCNAQGRMSSGVAKAISDKWPEVKEHYLKSYENYKNSGHDEFPLGFIDIVFLEESGKNIFNAITQQYYGYGGKKYVSYDAIDEVMKKISNIAYVKKDEKIVMPKIGAGLGGGDWNIIEKIIETHLSEHDVTIYFQD